MDGVLVGFITAYRSEPFVPPGVDFDLVKVVDANTLAKAAQPPYIESKKRFEELLRTKLPPIKVIEQSWEVVQGLLEALYVHFGIVDPDKLKAWRKRDSPQSD